MNDEMRAVMLRLLQEAIKDTEGDDIRLEVAELDDQTRSAVWEWCITDVHSLTQHPQAPRKHNVVCLLRALVEESKDNEEEPRRTTKHVLLTQIDLYDEYWRNEIDDIVGIIDRRGNEMMTFARFEALARLVKHGNLYKTQNEHSAVLPRWAPKGENVGIGTSTDDDVGWLVTQGLAEKAEHDPLLCLGKVVPTDKAADRLENHGLTPESPGVGVHLEHCCTRHGCKYGDDFCPVATGMFPPRYDKCGVCHEEEEWESGLEEYESDDLAAELRNRGWSVTAPAS